MKQVPSGGTHACSCCCLQNVLKKTVHERALDGYLIVLSVLVDVLIGLNGS